MTFAAIKDFVKRHPWAFRALAVLAIFLAGFGTAIVSRPAKVEEKVVTKTEVQTKVEWRDRVVTQKVYVEAEKKREHVETTVTKAPDGTQVTKVTRDVSVDDDKRADSHVDETRSGTATQTVKQVEFRDRLVLSQPNWDAHVGVGVSIPTFLLGAPEIGIPGLRGAVIDFGLDRRIAGPFWLGVWANSQGVVGVEGRLTW